VIWLGIEEGMAQAISLSRTISCRLRRRSHTLFMSCLPYMQASAPRSFTWWPASISKLLDKGRLYLMFNHYIARRDFFPCYLGYIFTMIYLKEYSNDIAKDDKRDNVFLLHLPCRRLSREWIRRGLRCRLQATGRPETVIWLLRTR